METDIPLSPAFHPRFIRRNPDVMPPAGPRNLLADEPRERWSEPPLTSLYPLRLCPSGLTLPSHVRKIRYQ